MKKNGKNKKKIKKTRKKTRMLSKTRPVCAVLSFVATTDHLRVVHRFHILVNFFYKNIYHFIYHFIYRLNFANLPACSKKICACSRVYHFIYQYFFSNLPTCSSNVDMLVAHYKNYHELQLIDTTTVIFFLLP